MPYAGFSDPPCSPPGGKAWFGHISRRKPEKNGTTRWCWNVSGRRSSPRKPRTWKEGATRRIGYRKGYAVMAYLDYQAPGYFIQAEHLLLMLLEKGFLKEGMRILDAGTGPGTVPSAISDFSRRIGEFSADIFPVERSEEFVDAFRELNPADKNGTAGIRIHAPLVGDLSTLPPESFPTTLDLVIFQNVLNEIPDEKQRMAVIRKLSGLLAPGGLVLMVEPADYQNATLLRKSAIASLSGGVLLSSPPAGIPGACTATRGPAGVSKNSRRLFRHR